MSWGQYFERYYELKLNQGQSPKTIESNQKYHRYFMEFLFKKDFSGTEIDVTELDFQAYAKWVNEQPLKQNSKRAKLQAIDLFYKEAIKQGWMLSLPTIGFVLPKKETIVPKTISVREMKRLLETPDIKTRKGIRDRMMMELLYSSALRSNELVTISPANFSEDYRSIRLIGKGNREDVVPVGRMAAHFIKFYIENIWLEGALISPTTNASLRVMLRKIGIKAKLRIKLSPHVFRYSIATHLNDEGADIRLIQEFLRHEDINTTARYIGGCIKELRAVHCKTHPLEKS